MENTHEEKRNISDSLGMEQYYKGLAEYIKTCDGPKTITIEGDWGIGKTTTLKAIERILKSENLNSEEKEPKGYRFIWFNTWQYDSLGLDDDLSLALLTHLNSELDNVAEQAKKEKKRKNLKPLFSLVRKGLQNASGNLNPILGFVSETINAFDDYANLVNIQLVTEQISQIKKEITRKIKDYIPNDHLIIFIDDLDRLDSVRAIDLLNGIQNLMDFNKCIFVLAIDRTKIEEGLQKKYGDTLNPTSQLVFLDKLVQVPYELPSNRYNYTTYIESFLENINDDTLKQKYVDITDALIEKNLRSIKQVFELWKLNISIYTPVFKEHFDRDLSDSTKYNLFVLTVLQQKQTDKYIDLATCVLFKQNLKNYLVNNNTISTDLKTEDIELFDISNCTTFFETSECTYNEDICEELAYLIEDSIHVANFTNSAGDLFSLPISVEVKIIICKLLRKYPITSKKLDAQSCAIEYNGKTLIEIYQKDGKDRIRLIDTQSTDTQNLKDFSTKNHKSIPGNLGITNPILYLDQISNDKLNSFSMFLEDFLKTYNEIEENKEQ